MKIKTYEYNLRFFVTEDIDREQSTALGRWYESELFRIEASCFMTPDFNYSILFKRESDEGEKDQYLLLTPSALNQISMDKELFIDFKEISK